MGSSVRQRNGRNSNKKFIGGELNEDDSMEGLPRYEFGAG